MEKVDITYLCRAIGNLCGFPVRLYEGEGEVLHIDHSGLSHDPVRPYLSEIFAMEDHVGTFITPIFHYYGFVRRGDTRLILGPVRKLPASLQELRELSFLCDVPPFEVEAFIQSMRSLTPLPLESLQQILCAMNHVMNGEELELEDILLGEPGPSSVEVPMDEEPYEEQGYVSFHNTLAIEQTLMHMVSEGDVEGIRDWVSKAPPVHAGPMAKEHLRQYKNTFVVTATLAARHAISAGLDAEQALSQSDRLIRHCEAFKDVPSILKLQVGMLLTYAQLVRQLREGIIPTPLALKVASYVQSHLSENISAEELATELHLSRPHLSRRFKEETGETLTDYILRKKSEEAARLLVTTDKSLSAISEYLGFSSQSHMSRVFRKYQKDSPQHYRLFSQTESV